ncbi:MAG: SHOCT-like domain-containing protein [Chloroflexota bacterium]
MSSEERRQILQMVEAGRISAEEALTLIRELEQDTPEAEPEAYETESGAGPGEGADFSSPSAAPELEQTAAKARSLWQIPLWIGMGFTVLSALGMYAVMRNAGTNFWFYCLTMPLFFGVAVMAFAGWSRTAHWLFVNVDRSRSEDGPRRIFLGFPLPLGLAAWFLRLFGRRIEGLKDKELDGMVEAISMVQKVHEPLIVNVDDSEDGERVQVYIG